jgi:hypothetical protein
MSWRDRAEPVDNFEAPKPSSAGRSWRDRADVVTDWVNEFGTTKQEMHPEISMKDRWIAKNFAQSPEKQVEYLRQQYPQLEIERSKQGQIRAKAKGERDWRVLDPNTGFFSSDFVGDLGDVGFDIYSGASEGAAATLGGIKGAAASLPLLGTGAIPGAMLAGGAATAGNEAIRQKLGQYLGIPQDVDAQDVAIAGGIGAAAPGLLGAGPARGALPVAGAYARKAMGSGLAGLGSKMSGVPKDVLMNYGDKGIRDQVTKLEKEGITDFAGAAFDKITNYVESNKDRAAKELIGAIEGAGKQADIGSAKGAFRSRMIDSGDDLLTNADIEKNKAVQRAFERYLGAGRGENFVELPDAVSAQKAFDLQKDLKQLARFEQGMTPQDVHMKGGARDAYFALNQALDDASEGLTTRAKDQYKAALREEAELLPKFTGKTRADSIQKTFNELSGLDRNSRKVMQEKLSKLSDDELLDLVDESKVMGAFKHLGNPSLMPISSGGTVSTGRIVPLAFGGGIVGGSLGLQSGATGDPSMDRWGGVLLGGALGTMMGSPSMMKRYIKAMQAAGRGSELVTDHTPFLPKDERLKRAVKVGIGTEMANE